MINYEMNYKMASKQSCKIPNNDFDKKSDTLERPEKSDILIVHQSKTYLFINFETKCFYNPRELKKGIHINGLGYVMRPLICTQTHNRIR